jgi:hypothetical protein
MEKDLSPNGDIASLNLRPLAPDAFTDRLVTTAETLAPSVLSRARAFRIGDVIANKVGSARDRVLQLFRRCTPFWQFNLDVIQFPEENLEHTRLVGIPELNNATFKRLFREFEEDYKQVETGDHERIDACFISHGLPIYHLEPLEELFHQYDSPAFRNTPLHLHHAWREALDNIHFQDGRFGTLRQSNSASTAPAHPTSNPPNTNDRPETLRHSGEGRF